MELEGQNPTAIYDVGNHIFRRGSANAATSMHTTTIRGGTDGDTSKEYNPNLHVPQEGVEFCPPVLVGRRHDRPDHGEHEPLLGEPEVSLRLLLKAAVVVDPAAKEEGWIDEWAWHDRVGIGQAY